MFFCCEACNETLKKNQVERHRCYPRCVTCVDCSKMFRGDEYKSHNQCISEAEKYEKTVYRGPKGGKAKRNPQEEWMALILDEENHAGAHPQVRALLQRIRGYSNIPRVEKKFKNFLNNSIRLRDEAKLDMLWGHLNDLRVKQKEAKEAAQRDAEEKKKAAAAAAAAASTGAAAGGAQGAALSPADGGAPSKERKREGAPPGSGEADGAADPADAVWVKEICRALKKGGGSMTKRALRKKLESRKAFQGLGKDALKAGIKRVTRGGSNGLKRVGALISNV